jgi:hypothetical protein
MQTALLIPKINIAFSRRKVNCHASEMRRTLLRKNRRQGVITHLVVDKQAVIKTGSDVLKVVKNNLYS